MGASALGDEDGPEEHEQQPEATWVDAIAYARAAWSCLLPSPHLNTVGSVP